MSRSIKLPLVTQEKDWPAHIISSGSFETFFRGESHKRFRQVHADLAAGAVFADGRPVVSKPDVLRWFIEQAYLAGQSSENGDRVDRVDRKKTY